MAARITILERSQLATVESTVTELRRFASSKTPFDRDHAIDSLLNLKIVATERKHPKSAFFTAVFKAILVLLGDREHEKVLEAMTKVDLKTFQSTSATSSIAVGGRRRRAPIRLSQVQCYYCNGYGHYQRRCPSRRESVSSPPPKHGRWDRNFTNW